MKSGLLCCLILLVAASLPAAQSASEVARDYYTALQAGDYDRAASFFAPAALREFRELMSFIEEIPDERSVEVYATLFGPGVDREQIAALSDAGFFGAFLGTIMQRLQELGGVNLDGMEIVGEVPEGDRTHVLTRNRFSTGDVEIEVMEVISFLETPEGWRAVLNGQIKGVVAQLRSALGAQQ